MCVCVCVSVCVCVCVCVCARVCGAMAQLVRESSMECLHSGTCRVASSSHSNGELWHTFLGQETHTIASLNSGV